MPAFLSSQDGSLQCPSCKTIYGEKTGTQPKGKMEVSTFPQSLPGHKDCGTIQIVYHISRGIQVSAQHAHRNGCCRIAQAVRASQESIGIQYSTCWQPLTEQPKVPGASSCTGSSMYGRFGSPP